MSTIRTMELPPLDDESALETALHPGSAVGRPADASYGPVAAAAPPSGDAESIAGETRALRRSRIAATAAMLAGVYAILLAWHLYFFEHHRALSWLLIGSRCALPTAIAGLLFGRLALSEKWVRAAEIALFGGMTVILIISQYVISLAMIERHDTLGMVAFMKNGVMQMIVMMLLYGTFLPNGPKTVFWAVAAMALAPLVGIALLARHPDVAPLIESLRTAEHTGSNALFLLLGAGMAVYGSYLLNGLRAELHRARKFGQYRPVRKLGEGGMGEVYLAEHLLLKRPCALKLIKSDAVSDPIARARFEREVQSAAQLSHPNTIEIYDYGQTDDGTFYYVMEYLRGLSLAGLVGRHGPLPAGRAIHIFRQVCAGLAEAHKLGLVHRDLKPANLFIAVRGGESDVAKILDFGLVKLTRTPGAADLSGEMSVSGTPMYMAPEQAMGDRSLDARADIYALGAVLYFAMTGRPPFNGPTAFAVMMAHARDPVVPPSQLRAGIPGDLERVILRCLAKRPKDRFPTVKALSDALAACASAAEWGANRADAWWAAEGIETADATGPVPPAALK